MNTPSAATPTSARWTIALCLLTALVEGFDIQSMGVAAPSMAPALGLTRESLGPVFSASIIGLLFGAAIGGRAADTFGRKAVLIVSLATFGLFSLATAFATDLNSLLTIRVLAGLGLGGALPNIIALSAESVAPARRAGIVTLMASGMPFGGAISGIVAATADWQSIFYLGGLIPLALVPLVAFAMPESRAFLDTKGSEASARGLKVLYSEGRALTTLLLWLAFFFTLLVLYLLLNWLQTLMASKGLAPRDANIVSALFNIGGGVGALTLSALMAQGRRWILLLIFYLGMAVTLIALAAVGADLTQAGAVGLAVGYFVVGAQLALYGLAPEFYPTAGRGTGVGGAFAMGRIGAIVGPLMASAVLASGGNAQAVLYAILPVVAVGGISALLLLRQEKARD